MATLGEMNNAEKRLTHKKDHSTADSTLATSPKRSTTLLSSPETDTDAWELCERGFSMIGRGEEGEEVVEDDALHAKLNVFHQLMFPGEAVRAKRMLTEVGPANLSFFVEGNGYWFDESSLMRAANAGAVDVIALLIEHKVTIDKEDRSGMTALHMACANDYIEAALLIVRNGGDPRHKDYCGRSPLDNIGRNFRLPWNAPLSNAVKKQRRGLLVEARKDYLVRMELKRRSENWARRCCFMLFLQGSRLRETVKLPPGFDLGKKLAPVPRDWAYLVNAVFAYNPRVAAAQCQFWTQGSCDLVELIVSFL